MTPVLTQSHTAEGFLFEAAGIAPGAWLADHTLLAPEAQALGLYLAQLEGDDCVKVLNSQILLPWAAFYQLIENTDEAELVRLFLTLPPAARMRPKLSHQNSLADKQFTVSVGWTDEHGMPIRSQAQRRGGILIIEGNIYLLSETAWQLCEAVVAFARMPAEQKSHAHNERAWSRMRKLALKSHTVMDDFLERTIVLTPDKLRVQPRKSELANAHVIEIMPLIEGLDDARWLRSFDGFHQVQDHYDVPLPSGGIARVIVEPAVREVLAELKRYPARRVAGERAKAFLRNPFALLGESAREVIDEEQFQEDLQEANIRFYTFAHRIIYTNGKVSDVELILSPEDSGITEPSILLSVQKADALQAFIDEIASKRARNFPCSVWDGYEIALRGDTDDQLESLRSALLSWQTGTTQQDMPFSRKPVISHQEVFDFTRYVPRVEGIGEFKPVYSPYIARRRSDQGWVPDNVIFGVLPNATSENNIGNPEDTMPKGFSKGEAPQFEHEPQENGQQCNLDIEGMDGSPISKAEAEGLKRLREQLQESMRQGKSPIPDGKRWREVEKQKSKRIGLLIKQNITAAEYSEDRKEKLSFVSTGKPELPNSLKPETQLMPHQLEGVEWLQHLWRNTETPVHVRGCIYADDMGLGKTLQLLTFIGWYLQTHGKERLPILIVAPVALLENWQNEMTRFFAKDFAKVLVLYDDELQKRRIRKADIDIQLRNEGITNFLMPDWLGNADIVLTTYEVLRDQEFSLSTTKFSIMICDEAQKIKSPSALVTKAAKAQNARLKIACTGTPVENSLTDLWCLFDFIQPMYLGILNEFSRTYRRPIEANTETERQAVEELRKLISDQILRRTKTQMREKYPDLVRLKNKKEDDSKECRQIPLSARQRELYAQAIDNYRNKRQRGEDGVLNQKQAGTAILSMLHHLRQICADPRHIGLKPDLTMPLSTYAKHSSKMAWLIDTLVAIQKKQEKVLIFTEFRDIQAILRHYIQIQFGIKPDIINGDTATASTRQRATRQQLIDRFQTIPGFAVLILSPVAVGFGVNIQAANHVIHYTRCWNPAKEDQATDRAYRIGQERDVTVYYPTIHAEDFITFERKLDELLTFKRRLAGDMLNGADDITLADLTNGIGLDKDIGSEDTISESELGRLEGNSFEKLCLLLWKRLGYHTEFNSRRPQGGVDIVAIKGNDGVVMQCKSSSRHNAHLGREALSDVIMDYNEFAQMIPDVSFKKIAITNQYFNEEVKRRAILHGVELIEKLEILELLEKHPIRLVELI